MVNGDCAFPHAGAAGVSLEDRSLHRYRLNDLAVFDLRRPPGGRLPKPTVFQDEAAAAVLYLLGRFAWRSAHCICYFPSIGRN